MDHQKKEIQAYYDQLASDYDEDRFENSYGNYLHQQEQRLLIRWLSKKPKSNTLDLACGTGRFLNLADYGVDFSKNMLAQAKTKFPKVQLFESDISRLPFKENQFDAIFSMHVFMHLNPNTIRETIQEAYRVLKKDGLFIFDFPNQKRRKAINYKKEGWHGNSALDLNSLEKMIGDQWFIEKSAGFLLFPVHRFPRPIRKYFRPLDSILCQTSAKHFSSYYCVCLKKK